jgi:hypothetical protein
MLLNQKDRKMKFTKRLTQVIHDPRVRKRCGNSTLNLLQTSAPSGALTSLKS